MATLYSCVYCAECSNTNDFGAVVDHCIAKHETDVLKVRVCESVSKKEKKLKTLNLQYIPCKVKAQGKLIVPLAERHSVLISSAPDDFSSPVKKMGRYEDTYRSMSDSDEESELTAGVGNVSLTEECETGHQLSSKESDRLDVSDDTTSLMRDIVALLPSVITALKEIGKMETYVKFHQLVCQGKLPLSNIAFLLFCDIVEWYSLTDTHEMRYSTEIKQFWRTGFRLFKGRFLRFMSGWKNQGQGRGKTSPEMSAVNFAVPDPVTLQDSTELCQSLKDIKPGVLEKMLELMSQDDEFRLKTYKLCVDGKKINQGAVDQKQGDIDLWGHEPSPSLREKKEQYSVDVAKVDAFSSVVNAFDLKGIDDLAEAFEGDLVKLGRASKDIMTLLGERLKTLREKKKSKVLTLEKLKNACVTEELKNKYTYAISSIKTLIYKLNACTGKVMKIMDNLGKIVSICQGTSDVYILGRTVDLSTQLNYFCLTGTNQDVNLPDKINTSVVKQRSEQWHKLRKTAKVTGSTAHKAAGLAGLKCMLEHFEQKFHGKEARPFDTETERRMQHGSDNEINAIATLVAKVLPVFFPNTAYVEEGCELLHLNQDPFMVISPDGSVREIQAETSRPSDAALMAVEIKCPYPDKLFTTPVFYHLPWYYSVQILSEMYALQTQQLLFLCYSDESTTVMIAEFDSRLWSDLMDFLVQIYGSSDPAKPKKLPHGIRDLQDRLKQYSRDRVRFLAEVPSATVSRTCLHSVTSTTDCGLNCHPSPENAFNKKCQVKEVTVSTLQTLACETKDCLEEAYTLSRSLASEVLVFMLSDLDRIHRREQQHSVPVAYALKGYSLTSSVLRQLIDEVLKRCFERGLYVPAVSFDGQWASASVRTKNGDPLTLLQLQKDVYKEAQKTTKSDMLRQIKQTNVVSATTCADVAKQVDTESRTNALQQYSGPITLGRCNACTYTYHTSSNVYGLLKTSRQQPPDEAEQLESVQVQQNLVRDDMSPTLAGTLEDDILSRVSASTPVSCQNANGIHYQENLSTDFSTLFAEGDVPFLQSRTNGMECEDKGSEYSTEPARDNFAEDISQELAVTSQTHTSDTGIEKEQTLFLTADDLKEMLSCLEQTNSLKWKNTSPDLFIDRLGNTECVKKHMTKKEIQMCLQVVAGKMREQRIVCAMSWTKDRLAGILFGLLKNEPVVRHQRCHVPRKRHVSTLKALSAKEVGNFPKLVLNAIFAEHRMRDRVKEWRHMSPFPAETSVEGVGDLSWFSKPEYVPETFTYLFQFLDCHHLFVNARVKCCTTGIPERGIKREAWLKVAQKSAENHAGLSIAHVQDLVDKQSNTFAQQTFSEKVEAVMMSNGDVNEARLCRLLREWYAAEDMPGLEVTERIRRRLRLRDWLLEGVDFNKFPPPGLHIRGIPHVMFEGLLTNIERRIQIFPYVRTGAYNPRALGSLEAENFFGAFQDLDPSGSGILRPDDVPKAIASACELIGTRLDKDRLFFMHTSKAKVYPMQPLEHSSPHGDGAEHLYMTPSFVRYITPRNHSFDSPNRGERAGKRKCGEISGPSHASRGAKPIRQYHKCDETKILPHVRMGLDPRALPK
ncbi:hypothetical protein BaRGS_00000879 [Batillaria attramentaria]|uniref:YqaJ viral recombinase domain-containing protein n=1 Tax=Batillaria attramentaria TaxID=370345 RepID=A0ABD0M7W0_9CAEN